MKLIIFSLLFLQALAIPSTALSSDIDDLVNSFALALERTEQATMRCIPDRDTYRQGDIHLISPIGTRGDSKYDGFSTVTVVVEQTHKPVHLLLYTPVPMVWELEPRDGAEIASVVVFGSHRGLVLNSPNLAQIFSIEIDASGSEKASCSFEEEVMDRVASALQAYRNSSFLVEERFALKRLSDALAGYASTTISSVIRLGPPDQIAMVGNWSMTRTKSVRRKGNAMLEFSRLPTATEQAPTDSVDTLPANLSVSGIRYWLIENELAEEASEELLEFLCFREVAESMTIGIDEVMHPLGCLTREVWHTSGHVILRQALDIGSSYDCKSDQPLTIHVPEGVKASGRFVNCNARLQRY